MSVVVEKQPDLPCVEPMSILRKPVDRRDRAERHQRSAVPWLLSVKLPWGLEVRLLNISSTGILLESGARLAPDSVHELTLCGPDTEVVVNASFVRSEVANVNGLGVKYHVAATFEKQIDLPDPSDGARDIVVPASVTTIAQLLAVMSVELAGASPLTHRAALERGIRQLVAARDVRICDAPTTSSDATALVSFSIPTTVGAGATLEATFDSEAQPSAVDLRVLRAAAGLAAVVIDFDRSV